MPWHRVVNVSGCISLPRFGGYEEQKVCLQAEGIAFDAADRIDLEKYLWDGGRPKIAAEEATTRKGSHDSLTTDRQGSRGR